MTGSALLTVIATILTVESGMVEIDLGRNGGLQAGDQGTVFYEIGVGDQVRSVEVGLGTVTEASSYTAKLQTRLDLEVRSGFLVRFEIPNSRISRKRDSSASRAEPSERPLAAGEVQAFVANTSGSCLNVRPLPATVMPALACVSEGTRLTIIDSVPDWKKTRLDDGREGWVATQFLSGVRTASPAPQRQVRTDLTQRPAPAQPLAQPIDPGSARERAENTTTSGSDSTRRSFELAEQLKDADSEIDDLLGRVTRSQSALSEAERKRTELTRRLLETTVAGLETQLDAARIELAETRSARADLMARVEELERNRSQLEGQLAASEAAERDTAAERAHLQAELAETQSNYSRLSLEHDRLARELEAGRSDLAQIEAIADAAKEALRNEIRNTETSFAQLRDQLSSVLEQLALRDAELEALETEREQLAAQVTDMESGSKWALRREARKARKALEEAERARAEAVSTEADLRADLDRASMAAAEAKELSAQIATLSSERDRLAATVARLEQRATMTDDRARTDLEAELADARFHISELEIRLARKDRESETVATKPPAQPTSAKIEDLSIDIGDLEAELVVLESAEPCLNFRSEPSLDGKIFECLEPGTTVGPVGRWEGWRYVELDDRRAGWVSGQHVGPVGVGGGGPGDGARF